ncbi:hypothetical protein N7519_008049 [Penicillium mononematosum]|uniref:uncharacterized protein n=1 Tax=Penicillium mononematosum TaxID=268346 RepID=UPI00254662B8|nr:uncharacterized protein N7519_008049 [Penicillium mononematosum]KAJ6186748.1 hypothetical protein N7519_008049 [Penicillium mononematosum]
MLCGNAKPICHDRIVILDLEEVGFHVENPCWGRSINSGNVEYLLSRYRYMRNPGRPRSPLDVSRIRLKGTYVSSMTLIIFL